MPKIEPPAFYLYAVAPFFAAFTGAAGVFFFMMTGEILAAEQLDEISVTATRMERATREVPAAIAVIGEKRIEAERMFNVKDAIQGTSGVSIESGNGGYSARLTIRGAGVKANYGIREIMVLRDGVPITDPDSFTRLDFIDPQDIERIEITKGPGSIHGSGSAGGVIQIISKSVFDTAGRLRAGWGEEGARNLHARIGRAGDKHALSLTGSFRASDNGWRRNNEFDSTQVSLKYGYLFDNGSALESELSFSHVNLDLPGKMGDDEFADYLRTGEQTDTKDAWKHTARDSDIWFFNSRWEGQWGEWNFKPRLFATHWRHFHPVTGAINVSDNNLLYGVDLEGNRAHELWGPASLVFGVTARRDSSLDASKYQYADVETGHRGRISETLSDRTGDLLEEQDTVNTLYGIYALETLHPHERLSIDLSARFDKSTFDIDTDEYGAYNYGAGNYGPGDGPSSVDESFDLLSLSAGISAALTTEWTLFATIAQSDQVPSGQEIEQNTGLGAATARNIEIGIKGRSLKWQADLSAYRTEVEDEIVSVLDNGETLFQNAGATRKLGVELSGELRPFGGLSLGGHWTYSDFTFDSFNEVVSGADQDRSGNHLPSIPRHRYGFWLGYEHESGWHGRARTQSVGSYWMDNANSERYGGYDFVTHLDLGYRHGAHRFSLNVENLFDKRYAVQAEKDTRGVRAYRAGAPRSVMAYWTMDLE